MADYPAKHEFVDDYPYLAYASEVDTIAGSGGEGGGGSYTLPVASADTLGGVKIGSGLAIDNAGVLSSSGGGVTVIDVIVDDQSAKEITETAGNLYNKMQSEIVYLKTEETIDEHLITKYQMIHGFNISDESYSFETSEDLYVAQDSNSRPATIVI